VRLPLLPSYLKIWIQALADYLELLYDVKLVHTSASQPVILLRHLRVERFCLPVKRKSFFYGAPDLTFIVSTARKIVVYVINFYTYFI